MKREILAEDQLNSLGGEWGEGEPVSKKGVPKSSIVSSLISAAELYQGDFVEARSLLKDLLWDGVTMLVARPKAGKSWLTLQIAVAVAGGPEVQGIHCEETGKVLYVALEEPKKRTMKRLRQIAVPGPWAANLVFLYSTDLLPLMGGGFEQLQAIVNEIKPRLIILDTLTALIKSGGPKPGSDVFRSQYAEVTQVGKLTTDHDAAVILVHHTKKGVADGAIDSVAGTGGVSAAVDCVWLLKRRPEGEATLDIVGRETEDQTLALKFGQEPFGWTIHGDDSGQILNAERRQILELLCDDGGLTPAQIAVETGKSRAGTRQMLKRMRADNQVQKQGLKYLPTHTMSHRVTECVKRQGDTGEGVYE